MKVCVGAPGARRARGFSFRCGEGTPPPGSMISEPPPYTPLLLRLAVPSSLARKEGIEEEEDRPPLGAAFLAPTLAALAMPTNSSSSLRLLPLKGFGKAAAPTRCLMAPEGEACCWELMSRDCSCDLTAYPEGFLAALPGKRLWDPSEPPPRRIDSSIDNSDTSSIASSESP